MEDILEEDWDDEVHGDRPEEGSEAWLDEDDLCGECTLIFENPTLEFPVGFFADEPLPSDVDGQREQEQRRIPLAELVGSDLARFREVAEDDLYHDPAPSTWHHTKGWKGNSGWCTITVMEPVTLRELLSTQPLCGDVWKAKDGHFHFHGEITCGDDGFVEWENGSHKQSVMEVEPPDNMRLWRIGGKAIGRFVCLLRRASERVYAPGGAGMESARREFETLASLG